MYFLSHMHHVCYFSILIRLMNGYLLFAANLDDFRAIAKKFVPQTMAESLTRMIDKPPMRDKLDDLENTEEASTEIDNDSLPPIKGKKEMHPPIKGMKEMQKAKEIFELSSGTKIDFDELVERVKKRLTAELKQTYLDNIRKEVSKSFDERKKQTEDKLLNFDNNDKVDNHNNNYNNVATPNTKLNKVNVKKQKSKYLKDSFNVEEMSPFTDTPDYKEDIFDKVKVKQKIKIKKIGIQPDYEDAMNSPLKYSNSVYKGNKNANPELENIVNPIINKKVDRLEPTTNPSELYKKMYLTQNDSYEDYVTPAKENIYASSEKKQNRNSDEFKQKYIPNHKRYKIETNRNSFQKNLKNNAATVKAKDTNERDIEKSQNNYDYTEKNVESEEIKAKTENLWNDNFEKVTEETLISSQTSKKPRHGTGLPTRHTYKLVTPNFVANFPVVVEKYNFDEPIPEKDRERETLKYIGNPPARINKKIRLT